MAWDLGWPILRVPRGRQLVDLQRRSLRKANRLITKTSKKNRRRPGFSPYMDRVGFVNRVDTVGFVMLVGYEDFPRLEP